MDKQKVSDELTKLVQLNRDSLADIKSDNQDIYNAMLNIMVAIDKKYGGLDLDFIQLDQEITSGGGIPTQQVVGKFGFSSSILTQSYSEFIFDNESKLKGKDMSVFYITFYDRKVATSKDDKFNRVFYVTPRHIPFKENMPIITYAVLKQTQEVMQMPLKRQWYGTDDGFFLVPNFRLRIGFDDQTHIDNIRVFVINEGNIWYDFVDDKLYKIGEIEIETTSKGKKAFVITYYPIGTTNQKKYFVCNYDGGDVDNNLLRQVRVTNEFNHETNLYPIAVDDEDFNNNIFYAFDKNKNKTTPSATPTPPKLGRQKLLNNLGSNDPDAERKMVTLPNGYRAEYDTSTTWSEDWSNKGWRPSPQRSASQSKADAVGYGADGNWYEIKTDKNGTQRWAKMKLGSMNDLDTLKKYIAKMSEEDIALLVDQKRYYMANTDRDEDEDIYDELDVELNNILKILESNGYEKYSNS